MKKLILTVILSLLLSLPNSSLATPPSQPLGKTDKESIVWLYEDVEENSEFLKFPNITPNILSSPSVYTELYVLDKLKNYDIKLLKTSVKRINVEIQKNTNTCAANRVKTPEREKYFLFSLPQNFYPSHKLYRLAQDEPLPRGLLNEYGEIISLKKLFEYFPQQKLGTGDDVSYGVYLDSEIDKLSKNNIYSRGGSKRIFALNEMLFKQRIDYVIYYPNEINMLTHTNQLIESYNIAGTSPYIIGHITCSKSEIGKKIINETNEILIRAHQTKAFHPVYQQWFLSSEMIELNIYLNKIFSQK